MSRPNSGHFHGTQPTLHRSVAATSVGARRGARWRPWILSALSPELVPWYIGTMKQRHAPKIAVQRVQTGVRIERRVLRVLKALATHHEMTLGDLLEGIVLHAFEGKRAFTRATLGTIERLRALYGLDLGASASHRLAEEPHIRRSRVRTGARSHSRPTIAKRRRR